MECGVEYRSFGPEHLNVVGETEFVRDLAKASAGQNKAELEQWTPTKQVTAEGLVTVFVRG
jgi:hypothetical protein